MLKPLMNLKIKVRLLIIIFISVASIFMVVYAAFYSNNSAKVMHSSYNIQKVHILYFNRAINEFYNFSNTHDKQHLKVCYNYLEDVNHIASVFSRMDEIFEKNKKHEIEKILYDTLKVGFNYNKRNAELMVSRLEAIFLLDISAFEKIMDFTEYEVELGERIIKQIQEYEKVPTAQNFEKVHNLAEEMLSYYEGFDEAMSHIEKFADKLFLLTVGIAMLIAIFLIVFFNVLILNSIIKPIHFLTKIIKAISIGDLSIKIDVKYKDEISKLLLAFKRMIITLTHIEKNAKDISSGDYSKIIKPKSNNDVLSASLNNMTISLRKLHIKNEEHKWLINGQNELNNLLKDENNLYNATLVTISFLAKYVNSQIGVFYIFDKEKKELKPSGVYSFSSSLTKKKFKMGEGMIGQVAKEKKVKILREVEKGYLPIETGLGVSDSVNIVFLPIFYQEFVIGVIELGFSKKVDNLQINFLKQSSEIIASSLNSKIKHYDILGLYSKMKINTEELKESKGELEKSAVELEEKQEEMKALNESLQEQSDKLKMSEEELRVQQEELRVTNEKLEEQKKIMEVHINDLYNTEKNYRAMSEEISNPFIIVENALILRYNFSFAKMFGHSNNEKMLNKELLSISADIQDDGMPKEQKFDKIITQLEVAESYKFNWIFKDENNINIVKKLIMFTNKIKNRVFFYALCLNE
ncbi:MAG: HAMP domain-containing protein [Bacteroidota bacterium]|nr:HAMP domain-containing protein [Bacteroidota bacterium]